jgi:uncharacterized protein YaaQ
MGRPTFTVARYLCGRVVTSYSHSRPGSKGIGEFPPPHPSSPIAHHPRQIFNRYNPSVKLAVCIVHNRDKNRLTDELIKAGFKFTIIGSTGGFLREGNTTILIGVEEPELESLKRVFRENCQSREQLVNVMPFEAATPGAFIPNPVKVPVGGAVIFLVDVESFLRF